MKKRETYKKYFDQIAKFFATVDIANDNFAEKNSVMIGVQKIDAWGNIDISTGESMFNAYNAVHLDVCYKAKHDKKIMDQYKREKANNDVLQGNRSN